MPACRAAAGSHEALLDIGVVGTAFFLFLWMRNPGRQRKSEFRRCFFWSEFRIVPLDVEIGEAALPASAQSRRWLT
jgi:hypothetical protein